MSLEMIISNLTDEECGRIFHYFRWTEGIRCVKCNTIQHKIYPGTGQAHTFRYYCEKCRIWFNDFSGTILDGTRLPLKQWFLAIYFFLEMHHTAFEVSRRLNINRNTAQSIHKKIQNEQLWCQLLLNKISGQVNKEVTFLMPLKEVQDYLGISRRSIYRLIYDGALSAIKVGGQWRFRPDEVQKYLNSRVSRYGTTSVKEYYFFRPEVLDKYRKDRTKYYVQDEAYQGWVGSNQDYHDVQTLGKKNLLGEKPFYNLHYRKVLTPEGHNALVISHKDYQQLPTEEYVHWSEFIITPKVR